MPPLPIFSPVTWVWFRLFLTDYFACSKFEFGLSGIKSFALHYFTNHWQLLYFSQNHPPTLAHFGKLSIQYSTATLPIHPLHDTPGKQSLANLFLIRSKFPSSDSPIPIFFQSFLHIYLISIQPLSRKFIISFSPLTCHSSDQINSLSKSCHFHTGDICRICHLSPLYVPTSFANSLFFSKLDYFNSLYNVISQANSNKYSAYKMPWLVSLQIYIKFEHITPVLTNCIGFQSKFEYLFE